MIICNKITERRRIRAIIYGGLMKKRIIAIFTIAVMALVTFASVAACDNTANDTADYTILPITR